MVLKKRAVFPLFFLGIIRVRNQCWRHHMHFHYKKIKGLFQVFWNIFFESSMHSLESKSSSGLQFKVVASLAIIWKDDLSIFPGIWSNAWMVRTFTPEAFESLPCENPLLSRTFLKFVIAFLPHFHVFLLIISLW